MTTTLLGSRASCDSCDKEYDSNNALGLMARHCKKTGHKAHCESAFLIIG